MVYFAPRLRSLGENEVAHHAREELLLLGSAGAEVMTNAELMSRLVERGLVFCLGEFVLGVNLADHFPSLRRDFSSVEVLNCAAQSNIEQGAFVTSTLER